jgi:hypothetical protein
MTKARLPKLQSPYWCKTTPLGNVTETQNPYGCQIIEIPDIKARLKYRNKPRYLLKREESSNETGKVTNGESKEHDNKL